VANLEFTPNEFCTINDSAFLENKATALSKIEHAFGALYAVMHANNDMPVKSNNGKISKGENYIGLPYMVLDYPRIYDKQNICAVRTMFYWANFFSCTLHVGGSYLIADFVKINAWKNEIKLPLYFCVNNNQWQNITNQIFEKQLQNGFIKLAVKAPLNQFEILIPDALKFNTLATIIMNQ